MAVARKKPTRQRGLPTSRGELERLAFAVMERWHEMPATQLVIAGLDPAESIRIPLRAAGRAVRLRDSRPPAPHLGRGPSIGKLWRMRDADFADGRAIGFSFTPPERPKFVALRGSARLLTDGRVELVLSGPPARRADFEKALCDSRARVDARTEGVRLEQRWNLPGWEPTKPPGRSPFRPADVWQMQDPRTEASLGRARRMEGGDQRGELPDLATLERAVEHKSDLALAALAEIGRLLARAKLREATQERNHLLRQADRRYLDSEVALDAQAKVRLKHEKAWIRKSKRTPYLGTVTAEIYREWGLFHRLADIGPESEGNLDDFGQPVPPPADRWTGLRQDIRRLRGACSAEELRDFLLNLHNRITTE